MKEFRTAIPFIILLFITLFSAFSIKNFISPKYPPKDASWKCTQYNEWQGETRECIQYTKGKQQ